MNAPSREIIFRVSNVGFEGSLLIAVLHGMHLFGPAIPLIVLAVAMGIGLVRSVRGLLATMRDEQRSGPGGVLQPRGIPHTFSERLPTVMVVAGLTLTSLILLTVLGLPGAIVEQSLALDGVQRSGTVVWADGRFERAHPLQYSFLPEGAPEEVMGRAVLIGPNEYRPIVGARVTLRYSPENPALSLIDPPQGLSGFPHKTVTAELATVTVLGWIYLISLFVQRPRDED